MIIIIIIIRIRVHASFGAVLPALKRLEEGAGLACAPPSGRFAPTCRGRFRGPRFLVCLFMCWHVFVYLIVALLLYCFCPRPEIPDVQASI